ncbi:MAG: hypothetical protein D6761_04955 [Candidatus Dadabacteria bacterium]|nr:MAG: hypothetical protein D6761_04955 [Candidatus Dadabacteria bacterium]
MGDQTLGDSWEVSMVGFRQGLLCGLFITLAACLPDATTQQNKLDRQAQELFDQATASLSDGNFRTAKEQFRALADAEPQLECEASIGLSLASLLELIEQVDDVMNVAKLGSGSFAPAQAGGFDVDSFLDGFLGPFEDLFAAIRTPAERAIAGGCSLNVPAGLPINLTVPVPDDAGGLSFIDARLRIGYEFDEGFERMLLAGIEGGQALFDFVLAHRFAFNDDVADAFENIMDTFGAFADSQDDLAAGAIDETERQTWISVARSLGVLFDVDPAFFGARNKTRLTAVDDDLEAAARTLFYRAPSGDETGLVPALIARNASDDVSDNVVAIIDYDHDQQLSVGDGLLLGLRAADVSGQFVVGDLSSGIEYRIPEDAGDVREAMRLVHEMLQNVGNALEAVEQPDVAHERVTIGQFNQIQAVLDLDFEPVPEVAEFDLTAYFTDPVPIRDLLPYWYDDDGDPTTPDVFLIEGESEVTTTAEPWIAGEDSAHFPTVITFGTAVDLNPARIEDLRIAADGVFSGDYRFRTPFPYLALQDPTLHGLLWLDLSKSPVAPHELADIAPADHFSLNKIINALGVHYREALSGFID